MGVKYFSEFDQLDSRTNTTALIRVTISDDEYVDEPILLIMSGDPLSIDFPRVDKKTSPVRGSRAVIQYMVDGGAFTAQELYTDQEQKWKVDIYRDGIIIWRGFVIPDGCSEPFMDPPYVVTIQAVDGLALLDKLKFVDVSPQGNGAFFTGKMSVKDIITACLKRTGIDMNFNTLNSLVYDGMATQGDAFDKTYQFTERYISDNGENVMNCGEVLKSILSEWVMTIVQMRGEWFLVRLNDVASSPGSLDFRKYDSDGVYLGNEVIDPGVILSNDDSGLIHCNRDQLRSNDFPYKEVTVTYKYGLLERLLSMGATNFRWPSPFAAPIGWSKVGTFDLGETVPSGIYILNSVGDSYLNLTESIIMTHADIIDFSFRYNPSVATAVRVVIKVGTWYLDPDGLWYEDGNRDFLYLSEPGIDSGDIDVTITAEIPMTAPLEIRLYGAYDAVPVAVPRPTVFGMYRYFKVTPNPGTAKGVIEENHTVENNGTYSTIPNPIETFNGESISKVFLGTLFKDSSDDPTNGWKRTDDIHFIPFLQITAEDIMKQYNRPMAKYEGSVYGYFNYLSVFNIANGLPGIFFPLSAEYDIKKNTTRVVLIELSDDDPSEGMTIRDVEYIYEKYVKVDVVG